MGNGEALMDEIRRDLHGLEITLGPLHYVRVGRVATLELGPLRYTRIGRTWILSWRLKL